MGGFRNSIIGGAAALIRAAIKSPNYVPATTGWSINKDGSADFANLTIRGTFAGTNFIINSSGAFFYSGTPANGNLVASVASTSGTDSFGNSYGAGFESYGALGTAAQMTSASIGLFSGLNVIVQMSNKGIFLYSPSGGLGNLVASATSSSGTDQYGNSYLKGVAAYSTSIDAIAAIRDGNIQVGTASQFTNNWAASFGQQTGGVAGISQVTSGVTSNLDTFAFIELLSQVQSGITGGAVTLTANPSGRVYLDGNQNQYWDANGGPPQWQMQPGSGPFIAGEGFHGVSAASGMSTPLTGSVAVRVKKLPWNAIWIEVESAISTTSTSLNLGSLPDSTYYPTTTRHFPIVTTGTPIGRLFVPTSGGLQIVLTASASGLSIGGAFMYANN